jgi:hypothetical protein
MSIGGNDWYFSMGMGFIGDSPEEPDGGWFVGSIADLDVGRCGRSMGLKSQDPFELQTLP